MKKITVSSKALASGSNRFWDGDLAFGNACFIFTLKKHHLVHLLGMVTRSLAQWTHVLFYTSSVLGSPSSSTAVETRLADAKKPFAHGFDYIAFKCAWPSATRVNQVYEPHNFVIPAQFLSQ